MGEVAAADSEAGQAVTAAEAVTAAKAPAAAELVAAAMAGEGLEMAEAAARAGEDLGMAGAVAVKVTAGVATAKEAEAATAAAKEVAAEEATAEARAEALVAMAERSPLWTAIPVERVERAGVQISDAVRKQLCRVQPRGTAPISQRGTARVAQRLVGRNDSGQTAGVLRTVDKLSGVASRGYKQHGATTAVGERGPHDWVPAARHARHHLVRGAHSKRNEIA